MQIQPLKELKQENFRIPFKMNSQQIRYILQMEECWNNQNEHQWVRVISHPLSDPSTIATLCFILEKVSTSKKQLNIVYITDTKARSSFLFHLTSKLIKLMYSTSPNVPHIGIKYQVGQEASQIVFTNFIDFAEKDLPQQNIYNQMIVESSNYVRMINDGFKDYITDVYLRRAFIECLRLQQAYRDLDKPQLKINVTAPSNISKQNSQDYPNLQIISLVSQAENQEKNEMKQNGQTFESKKIRRTFQAKKDNLLTSKKKKEVSKEVFFNKNQLVLISGIIYVIGFFYSQLFQNKKIRNLFQFLDDFEKKTLISLSFLQNIMEYFHQIFQNCPSRVYDNPQETYLFYFCNFLHKLTAYRKIFPTSFQNYFDVKIEKFPFQKRQALIEQSSLCISIVCKPESRLYLQILKQKSLNCVIIQSIACPQDYWHYLFKIRNVLSESELRNKMVSNIYGLHISKTPSNEDLNFSQKLKSDIETIKIKASGVLLSDLAKFVPDGIVVYFHSLEGLESFVKQMERQDEKILKRIDNNKRIFFQTAFEEQNDANFKQFKKTVDIGRGAMFLMAANGKTAQNLKFYNHLSRCIVFFGLPKKEGESFRKQVQLKKQTEGKIEDDVDKNQQNEVDNENYERISIFNECINNCINNVEEHKSIIFVGREITSDLSNWYNFIKSWDETTRQSLMKLRHHYQGMGVGSKYQ